LDKKFEEMIADEENNEIGGEFNIDEIKSSLVNNITPKFDEFGESSRRNSHFMRPRYVIARRTTNFSFEFISRKAMSFEEISLNSNQLNILYPKH